VTSLRDAPPTEAQLEAFFRKRVRMLGGHTIKLAPTEKGVPDRLVAFPGGRLFLVELKTDTGSLSPAQVVWHSRMDDLGVRVHVLYGADGIVAWLRGVFGHYDPPTDKKGRPKLQAVR
jgi:hypothetical protein